MIAALEPPRRPRWHGCLALVAAATLASCRAEPTFTWSDAGDATDTADDARDTATDDALDTATDDAADTADTALAPEVDCGDPCAPATALCGPIAGCDVVCPCPSASECSAVGSTCACVEGCDERGPSTMSTLVALAFDPLGAPLVARLVTSDKGGFDVVVDRFDGTDWGPSAPLLHSDGASLSMAADADGVVHLVAEDHGVTPAHTQGLGLASGWAAGAVPDGDCLAPQVQRGMNAELYLGCESLTGFRVYRLVDGAWATHGPALDTIAAEASPPAVFAWAVGGTGAVEIVYTKTTGDEKTATRAQLPRTTADWELGDLPSSPYTLGPGVRQDSVALGLDKSSNPHAMFADFDAGTGKNRIVHAWRGNNGIWNDAVLRIDDAPNPVGDYLGVIPSPGVGLYFLAKRSGRLNSQLLEADGTWHTIQSIDISTAGGMLPRAVALAADPAGRVHAVLITQTGTRILWTPPPGPKP